jgi:hypothetical protein
MGFKQFYEELLEILKLFLSSRSKIRCPFCHKEESNKRYLLRFCSSQCISEFRGINEKRKRKKINKYNGYANVCFNCGGSIRREILNVKNNICIQCGQVY